MANAMPQLVWVGMQDGAVVFMNDQINDYIGAFQQEDGTWHWQGMIHPDDLAETLGLWAHARAAGLAFEVEHRLHTKTGGYRWHLNRAKPHMDISGKPTRWYGSSIDIHLQKEAERSLRASEAEFRASFEDASVGMIQIDPDTGRFLRTNTAFRDIMGYLQDGLPELNFPDILLQEDREREWTRLQDLVAGRSKGYYSEGRLVRRDGAMIWCIRSASLVYDDRGKASRISMVIRDITRKKKTEEALLDSEAKFKAFLHDSPLLAWSKDSQGRYVYLNSSFEKRFDVKLDDWKGKTDKDIHQADYARVFQENDLQVLTTGEPLMGVEQMLERDGSVSAWSSFKFRYTDSEGNTYVGGVGYDITKQKEAEDLLLKEQRDSAEKLEKLVAQRTRELKASNEGLQQFAHVASHDLKEPVRKIKIFGGRLRDEYGGLLPESARRYLSKIESAANRMFTMIEGVLQYSSIQAIPENFEKIPLSEVIAAIEMDLELVIQQRSAKVKFVDLPEINGIPVMIYQLFYNLINNAIKFARQDMPPEVHITATEVMADGSLHHRIVVKDNGIGFEADEVERIFDTFTRLHPKDLYDGTGLGLSLCRKIVEKHHGSIEAASEPGQGARFTILLPADPTMAASKQGS